MGVQVLTRETVTPKVVDVVTTGTFGVMSGTMAIVLFLVAKHGSFRRPSRCC